MAKFNAKLLTTLGISTALLVGAGSTYAAQKEKNDSVTTKASTENVSVEKTIKAPTSEEIESVLQGEPTPPSIKVEGLFSTNGKPDYTADFYLNDAKLFSLLKISATDLKQELAKGKTVVEIAADKNISKQQVIDVISNTQIDVQIEGEQNGETPKSNRSKEEMLKDIEPNVLQVIEHKTETPWK
ncbi:hypothetical protein CN923_12665 [Bacillus cereus]|nr:hypothetical protein CON44_26155 [Bacillus cereus]PEQ40286.1 hypothetical protein CN467_10865 [Bacillus cereus]PEX91881.1 hypothetical protein CN465_23795 [Bacillus cereus]PFK29652.1 hypothetical protein COJ05_01115 [Bacillus cereus]PFP48164.1 hypothetical protein COK09_30240 [Bacillus cereus]